MSQSGLRALAPLLFVVGACVVGGLLLSDREILPAPPANSPLEPESDDGTAVPGPPAPAPGEPDAPPEPGFSPEPGPSIGRTSHPARVRGEVLALDGRPVEGAKVALLSTHLDWRGRVPIAAVTDAEGRFVAGHDGKASVLRLVVDATSQGYFVEERSLDLIRLGVDAEVTVRIEKGLAISGRALDHSGAPLANAAVHLLEVRAEADLDAPGTRRPVEGHVETDEYGRFSDDGYRRGIYRLFLTGEIDGHEFAVVKEGVEAGEADVELRFMGFGKRWFTFEAEETGERVSVTEIAVDLIYAHTGENEEYVPWAEFNNREEVKLSHLPQGHYRLRLIHPDFVELFSEVFFVEAGSDPGEICHRLRPNR